MFISIAFENLAVLCVKRPLNEFCFSWKFLCCMRSICVFCVQISQLLETHWAYVWRQFCFKNLKISLLTECLKIQCGSNTVIDLLKRKRHQKKSYLMDFKSSEVLFVNHETQADKYVFLLRSKYQMTMIPKNWWLIAVLLH